MSNKPSITYIKDGKEQTINNFFCSKLSVQKFLYLLIKNYNEWDLLYKTELFNEYQILKNEIEYIHIKNGIFTRNVELYCDNPDSIVILEDCIFKCDFIDLEHGNYQIINPKFNPTYRNVIRAFNCESVEIKGNGNTNINIFDASRVKNINLNSINEIKVLDILENFKTIIKEVNKIEEYSINIEQIEIKKCPSSFNLFQDKADYYHRFLARTVILENTNIICHKNNWYFKTMKLENSSICYSNNLEKYYFPNLKELILDKSYITSTTSIAIPKIKKIELDDTSYLKVKDFIQIGNYEYKNELNYRAPFTLNKYTLNEVSFLRRNLINYLIEISDIYHSKIINQLYKEEHAIIYELEKDKYKQIKLIEEISNKKINRAKKKVRLKQEYTLLNTKIGNIN